jgi:UDP-3-O-[3-hydroxymyristoyl] glucosamine N-acyltransferase
MKLAEIAKQLGCTVDGDAQTEIRNVAGIEEAQKGDLTFLVNRKYRPRARLDAGLGDPRLQR